MVLALSPHFDIVVDMDTMVYDQIRSVSQNDEKAAPDHEPECYGGTHTLKPYGLGGHGLKSRAVPANALLEPFCRSSKLG